MYKRTMDKHYAYKQKIDKLKNKSAKHIYITPVISFIYFIIN